MTRGPLVCLKRTIVVVTEVLCVVGLMRGPLAGLKSQCGYPSPWPGRAVGKSRGPLAGLKLQRPPVEVDRRQVGKRRRPLAGLKPSLTCSLLTASSRRKEEAPAGEVETLDFMATCAVHSGRQKEEGPVGGFETLFDPIVHENFLPVGMKRGPLAGLKGVN